MKLSLQQIKSICVGAVRITEESDGFHFDKCTEKQKQAWKKESENYYTGACTTTGVRLDFHTNSKKLTFSVSEGGKFEIFLDGQFRYQFIAPKETISIDLNDSRKEPKEDLRVTLCLPSHSNGVLESVELDDGATLRRHEFDCKMMMFGDSITQGWDSELDSFSWAYRVSRFFNADSIIQGIGGTYYLEEFFDGEIDFDPDMITVAYGTNDAHRKPLDFTRANAAKFMDLLIERYRGKKIFVISPIWRGHSDGRPMEDSFVAYRTAIEEEAKARKEIILINGLELLPPEPRFYADTYLHPNMLGFGVYAENVIRFIQKHL